MSRYTVQICRWGRQKMVESEQGWEQLLARRQQLEQEVAAVDKVSYDWSHDLNTLLSLVHTVPRTDR